MSKKNKFLSRARHAYNVISSPIANAILPDNTFRAMAAEFLSNHPAENFERDFAKLCANSRFRRIFASSLSRIQDVVEDALSIIGLQPERAWQLCRFTLQAHRDNLQRFAPRRKSVERLLLLGSGENALAELEVVKEEFGESFWYVRTKMLLLSELRRTNELAEFCDSLSVKREKSLVGYLIHSARVLIDTDNPLPVLKNLIFSATNELKQAKHEELAALLELLFAPRPLNDGVNFWLAIERAHAFPAIDQFILLEQIIRFALAENGITQTVCPFGNAGEVADFLAKTIGTESLTRTVDVVQEVKITGHGKKILDFYETGCYNETIATFYESLENLENPLAYVNLVAKSTAMLKQASATEIRRNGIIPTLVAQLAQIYGIEASAAIAEETIKSLAARFNSAGWCIHVQIALYKALPWRYEGANRRIAAKLALLTDREVTPLLSQMAESPQYLKELLPSDSCVSTPGYRNTKRQLIFLIQQDILSSRCRSLLEELNRSNCLIKDKVEVRSLYLIKSAQYDELLHQAAVDLCRQPTLYLILPMARLVAVIEMERIATLSALVVVYFYNKFISQ